jgi:predicted ATPase/DNA-binding SARP family transcriptional activator
MNFIQLFGPLRIQLDAHPGRPAQTLTRFRTHATGGLIAYLALHPDVPHTREKLIEFFWSDQPPQSGRNNLSLALSSLRRLLNHPDASWEGVLTADRHHIQLHSALVDTDVALFESAMRTAAVAAKSGDVRQQLIKLEEAVAFYSGELLEAFDYPWTLGPRARLTDEFLVALRECSRLHSAHGNADLAVARLRQLVTVAPLREEFHRDLIALLLQTDQREEAGRQFMRLSALLESEFGEKPSPETQELVRPLGLETKPGVTKKRSDTRKSTPKPEPTRSRVLPKASSEDKAAAELRPARVPRHLNRFLGRSDEMAEIREWIDSDSTRLMTLTGIGGIGKTRLATEVASHAEDCFDSIYFVPLAGIDDVGMLPFAIGDALRLPPPTTNLPFDHLVRFFSAQGRTLLILDNLEQLLAPKPNQTPGAATQSAAEFVQRLLESVPSLRCLATSRTALSLPGERRLALLPLSTPASGPPIPPSEDVSALLAYASVSLFVDRARLARPDFQLTARNGAVISDLCRLLEGIPLAIELTAAWAAVLTPAQMRDHLDKARLDLIRIRRSQRHLSPRHHSLRSALGWSCDLLPTEVQSFFARLSVFRGGFTEEAAEAITEEPLARHYLAQLRDASLVEARAEEGADRPRFSLLEVTRQFAAERLPSAHNFHANHARWYRDRTSGSATSGDYKWLDREAENLYAALEWAGAHQVATVGVSLAAFAWPFWDQRGRLQEGRGWLERVLEKVRDGASAPAAELARVYAGHGKICFGLGDFGAAGTSLQTGLELGRAAGDASSVATSLLYLGILNCYKGELEQADRQIQESLALHRDQEDRAGIAAALLNWGIVAGCRDQYSLSYARWEEAVQISREIRNDNLLAHGLCYLGDNEVWLGRSEQSARWFDEALALSRTIGLKLTECYALIGLARLAVIQSRFAEAEESLKVVYVLTREAGLEWGIAFALETSCCAAAGRESYRKAALLWGSAIKLRESIGAPLPTAYADIYQPFLDAARERLGESEFLVLQQQGYAMSRDQATELAEDTL